MKQHYEGWVVYREFKKLYQKFRVFRVKKRGEQSKKEKYDNLEMKTPGIPKFSAPEKHMIHESQEYSGGINKLLIRNKKTNTTIYYIKNKRDFLITLNTLNIAFL